LVVENDTEYGEDDEVDETVSVVVAGVAGVAGLDGYIHGSEFDSSAGDAEGNPPPFLTLWE
jgi:hypothetical protein